MFGETHEHVDHPRERPATVVWATGFRPGYRWLDVPVLDGKGRLRHVGGALPDGPGLYVVGLSVLRWRKSTFIHGAEDDGRDVVDHLAGYLDGRRGRWENHRV